MIENDLLTTEIDDLHQSLLISEDIIHNKNLVINHYDYLNTGYEQQVQKLNKQIKKNNNTIYWLSSGAAAVTLGLLLFIFVK